MRETLYSLEPTSRQSFVKFLKLLAQDFKQNQHPWENDNLESFLEAMSRYAEDIDGYYANMAEEPGERISPDVASWRLFADILRGAIVYE